MTGRLDMRDAALLYPGQVMHARMKPKPHRFTYSVFNLLIDVRRLADAHRQSRFFSVGRANLLAFFETDHGDGRGDLTDHVEGLLRPTGTDGSGPILLLCYPRLLGFVFNPISVYFVHDTAGGLTAVIYEVRNTFGEMHTYVCPIRDGEMSEAGIRQERDKLFYVSPFVDMPMRYFFRIRPPGERMHVRILETDAEGPILAATFAGRAEALTTLSALKAAVRWPLMTLKVVAGIHWEATKLWFKGVRFHNRPAPPPAASYDGIMAGATDAKPARY
jgi:uncharacterized protein